MLSFFVSGPAVIVLPRWWRASCMLGQTFRSCGRAASRLATVASRALSQWCHVADCRGRQPQAAGLIATAFRLPRRGRPRDGLPSGVHLEGEFFQVPAVPRTSVRIFSKRMRNCDLLSQEGLPPNSGIFRPMLPFDRRIDDLHLHRLAGEMFFAPHKAGVSVQCTVSLLHERCACSGISPQGGYSAGGTARRQQLPLA